MWLWMIIGRCLIGLLAISSWMIERLKRSCSVARIQRRIGQRTRINITSLIWIVHHWRIGWRRRRRVILLINLQLSRFRSWRRHKIRLRWRNIRIIVRVGHKIRLMLLVLVVLLRMSLNRNHVSRSIIQRHRLVWFVILWY